MLHIFHFDISGKLIKDEHSPNKPFKLLTLLIFHSDMSGKFFNDVHL